MTLQQLQYFVTVCKYQNLTKAAHELSISQPGISTSIRELETKKFKTHCRGKNNSACRCGSDGDKRSVPKVTERLPCFPPKYHS